MTLYIAPEYRQLLEANQLSTFDSVWEYPVNWLDEPNRERGGWSGVGRIALKLPENKELGAYLKRQDNHGRWSFRHPFAGEPTFTREFEMLGRLNRQGIAAPRTLFFGRHLANGHHRATLLIEELAGYRALDEITRELHRRPGLAEKDSVLNAVAAIIRALHKINIEHRALYPKHIFIKLADGLDPEIALIDLEKARFNIFSWYSTYLDLASLNKHAKYWSNSRRLYFYKQYFGIPKLGFWTKWLARQILKRSARGKRVGKKAGKKTDEK